MDGTKKVEFEMEKRMTIKAAKELFYDKHVIEALERAENGTQLTNIMITARRGKD